MDQVIAEMQAVFKAGVPETGRSDLDAEALSDACWEFGQNLLSLDELGDEFAAQIIGLVPRLAHWCATDNNDAAGHVFWWADCLLSPPPSGRTSRAALSAVLAQLAVDPAGPIRQEAVRALSHWRDPADPRYLSEEADTTLRSAAARMAVGDPALLLVRSALRREYL